MGIFDKLKGGKKDKVFEDELMDTQSELIALTLNMVGKAADKIFAYCSIEAKSQMFNVFFELDGQIKTLNEMGTVPSCAMELLRTGTHGLDKIKEVCAKYNYPTPTEIKMIYDVKTKKFNVAYQYKEICSAKTNISAGEVFMNWVTAKKNEST